MKRTNRFLLLGLLGVLGGAAAWGQVNTSIRIVLSDPDAKFIVDGQIFIYNQNFVWPEGSTHVVEFPTQFLAADTQPYQYHLSGRARWSFGGWSAVSSVQMILAPGSTQRITASRTLTELKGTVVKEFPVDLDFSQPSSVAGCTQTVEEDQIDRAGVMLLDGNCFAQNQTLWLTAGTHHVQALPYPGYYFAGMLFHGGLRPYPPAFDLEIDSSIVFGPSFQLAKRVRFSTVPAGLQVLVDRAPVTPQTVFTIEPPSAYCGAPYIPLKTPLGIQHLCVGDFDFVPGSPHQIAAQDIQTNRDGDFWIFDRFSNGMGQNSTLIAPTDVNSRTDIAALFIHGVRSTIDTTVPGLRVVVDGQDVPPSPRYGFIWAEGSTHRLAPPVTQKDAKGRVWKFVRWSDGGDRERDVKIPVGGGDFRIAAEFEILGQIQVTSAPLGLSVKVNGGACVTPCTYDGDPGAMLALEASQNVGLAEGSRYDFLRWTGGTAALSQQATYNRDVQVFSAQYRGSHRILAYSDPDGGAKFTFSPESTDGFFPEGSTVQITAVPNTGFKFLAWDQDLSSRSAVERIVMSAPATVVAKLEKVAAIAPAGIRNAAGDTPDGTVAPGSIISIYGANLTEELLIGPSNPLAQAIGDIYVTVNDSLLPLIFVSPSQINAQLLSTLGEGEYVLKVHATGKPDMSGTLRVKRNAPGVFFNLTADGMPLVAALHQDGTPISQQSPGHKGETISFFGTGLGGYDRPIIDGFILPGTEVYNLLDPVKVVAGVPQTGAPVNAAQIPAAVRDPSFAGGAPGMVGTNLVRVKLDADLPPGKVLELSLSVNGAQSNKVQLPIE